MPEQFHETSRGMQLGEEAIKKGNGQALVEELARQQVEINTVNMMNMTELKKLRRQCSSAHLSK